MLHTGIATPDRAEARPLRNCTYLPSRHMAVEKYC